MVPDLLMSASKPAEEKEEGGGDQMLVGRPLPLGGQQIWDQEDDEAWDDDWDEDDEDGVEFIYKR